MTKDEQEALSRACSNDVILLLPLKSGAIAVFNNARELCSIIEPEYANKWRFRDLLELWHKPASAPRRAKASLEELGLL